ncbi:tetratricopeptide repeat protein [Paraburkholderia sp. HD33-4]|uniref:tetratricopeptide repeat protein n=1 Tax=Paraburkholderia sp. HD33-4 TaxID=2883242 RepID=UPI001F40E879|nr:tetratricopeptide repeat protein [Paraburkholderia sp. HD33-4]
MIQLSRDNADLRSDPIAPPVRSPLVGCEGIQDDKRCVSMGDAFLTKDRCFQAEACYRQAIELRPDNAVAHAKLAWTLHLRGEIAAALSGYRLALLLDSSLQIARRNLAKLLITIGESDAGFRLCHEELVHTEDGAAWLRGLISAAMQSQNLSLAGEYATIYAQLCWGSSWYPSCPGDAGLPLPAQHPTVTLSIPKLRHDIEQFEYLQKLGVIGDEFRPIINEYQHVIDRLMARGSAVFSPLDVEDVRTIGHVYNRIVHVRSTPRVEQALSNSWDAQAVERQYIAHRPGIVVLDDFLSREALASLYQFCLESTVWLTNRYAHGRLGAFFDSGFNCPLLLQVAEELRQALPRVLGDRYPLRQMWGFKYENTLPDNVSPHADFAAVNVNFWITPDEANLDEKSGGLVVYDVDAPIQWSFDQYQHTRWDTLGPFLSKNNARAMVIPYRQNRAIIFNSDLFHVTAGLRFRKGYENRRINITMLYGDRENDAHHPQLTQQQGQRFAVNGAAAWRSAAFARARKHKV